MNDTSFARFWFRLYQEEDPELVALLEQYDGATRGRVIRRLLRLGHGVETGGLVTSTNAPGLGEAARDDAGHAPPPNPMPHDQVANGLALFGLDPAEFTLSRS